MIDFAKIRVAAGSGGSGSGSFFKIKGKRYGKADGGDGGKGGDVYIQASADLNTLERYRYVKDYKAQNGQNGTSSLRRGAQGTDLVLKVPMGTTVTVADAQTYDLTQPGQKVLLARAGIGGRGNSKLKDEFGRRPKAGEAGEPGEEKAITLELKLIADVGLIGLPNAGKSTLLSKLTAAKPQIAPYPFTTLEPNLGVLQADSSRLVLADIPGLIEGASAGRGLGDLFLRHIERTKLLVHLIDITNPNPWQAYQAIRNELKAYSKELAKKKEIIVLTKIDLADEKTVQSAKDFFASKRKKALAISAEKLIGLQELIKTLLPQN